MRKAAQVSLEDALRDAAEKKSAITRLELKLASYVANNVTTKKEERLFTASVMKYVDAGEHELDQDFYQFAKTRNALCHNPKGTHVTTVDHEPFQILCCKIQATMSDMEARFPA
ncbi:hypothetical protein PHMEG_00018834 [Phytophthora megakarya]|uniref:Uncharacterized protein n=1 Tax=Phytophthora megakarya TaxID=4795 RepID=A0A225VT28_9STRA|nr:hypothetical protein PHMEG_00018834 [Phytophthora megakarya]